MSAPYAPGDDPDNTWEPTPEQAWFQSQWEAQADREADEACAREGAYVPAAAPADGAPKF